MFIKITQDKIRVITNQLKTKNKSRKQYGPKKIIKQLIIDLQPPQDHPRA